MTQTFSGSGPGIQTPDGCSVELYSRMPYMGELEEVVGLFEPDSEVLELGCGTGRLCARLLELGTRVVGVDESAEMLALLPAQVTSVRSRIEELHLERKFDSVLLASHLINHPAGATRDAFVRCARRHLRPRGRFLIKRHSTKWLQGVEIGPQGNVAGIQLSVDCVKREDELVRMTITYATKDARWSQSFSTVPLHEGEIEELLLGAGFAEIEWYGKERLWASAVASDASPGTDSVSC